MKVHFDEQSDAVYFRLDDSVIVESEEVKPGFILDYNAKNEIVGFEILHVAHAFQHLIYDSFSLK